MNVPNLAQDGRTQDGADFGLMAQGGRTRCSHHLDRGFELSSLGSARRIHYVHYKEEGIGHEF